MTRLVMPTTYSPGWVALSLLISAAGAFVALTAASRIAEPGRSMDWVNLLAAGAGLGGIGIWSMHFVGMLALHVDMGVSYSLPETLASLLLAIGGSAIGLLWVARNPQSVGHIAGAGMLLGVAVVAMHYLGMAGMRFGGVFDWDTTRIAISVAIAVVAATAALVLAFRVRGNAARLGASAVMALAVGAMHYTGMSAAAFICTTTDRGAFPTGPGLIPSLELPLMVTTLSLGLAFIIAIDQAFQRFAGPAAVRG